jgi:hypothetical protein
MNGVRDSWTSPDGLCPECGHPIECHTNTNGCSAVVKQHEDSRAPNGSVAFRGGVERCLCQWMPWEDHT